MGMFKGRIHWFDSRKKYGYVVDGYNNEYFFHQNGIKKGRQIVIQGFESDDEVEFDLVDGEKGKMATNLEIIGDFKPKFSKSAKPKKDKPAKEKGSFFNKDNQMAKALEKAGYTTEAETKEVEVPDAQTEDATQPE